MKKLTIAALLCLPLSLFAQNVGIGTNAPNSSAKLEISDANRGLLIPRLALTATNAAGPVTAPANSLLVYNTATVSDVTPGYYYWSSSASAWIRLAEGKAGWEITGNNGIGAANFLGTINNADLIIRTNNTERMRVTAAGNVGVGTNAPNSPFAVRTANAALNARTTSLANAISDQSFELATARGSLTNLPGDVMTQIGQAYNAGVITEGFRFHRGIAASDGAISLITSGIEQMRVNSAGDVGIGVVNPLNQLDIASAVRSGTHGTGLPLYVTGTLGSNNNGVEFRHDNGSQGIGFGFNTIYATGSNANQDLGLLSRGTGNLNFSTNSTARMIILGSNGNVGIGTINPLASLEVAGGAIRPEDGDLSAAGINWGVNLYGGGGDEPYIRYYSEAGENTKLMIANQNDADDDITLEAGFLNFRTGDGGTTVADADRMRITTAGLVGINNTAPNQRLTVNGNIEMQDNNDNVLVTRNTAQNLHHQNIGTYMGWDQRGVYLGGYNQNNIGAAPYNATNRIYCGGSFGSLPITATAFTVASSQRYKHNIVPVAYGLAAIMQLRPVQYQYTFEKLQQTRMGLIAEEVNEVIPEIVVKQDEKGEETTDVNGKTMGINYSELTPVLVKALQEQQAQIELLKKQNQLLEQRLQSLENKK